MNKITLSAIASVSLAIIAGASWYGYSSYQAGANPDYICTARIANPTCVAQSYGPWVNGVRTVYGTEQVSVVYSNRRISCQQGANEAGMNVVVTSQEYAGNTGGASGVHGNAQYSTRACEVLQTAPAITTSAANVTDTTGNTGGVVDSTVEVDTGSTTGTEN